jgi:transcriptional regulator with GAF, ATPase, and Fis domain
MRDPFYFNEIPFFKTVFHCYSTEMDTLLWREAATAQDVDGFVRKAGPALLEGLDATFVALRRLSSASSSLVTLGVASRDAEHVRVDHRLALSPASYARVDAWLSTRVGASCPREIATGVPSFPDGPWVAHALVHGSTRGVLLFAPRDPARAADAASVAEPLAVVLANDEQKHTLRIEREAATAEKDAVLARMQVRDIGVAIIGADTGLRAVFDAVTQVAGTDAPVLILGETGSGKEVVARSIHEGSSRARGPVLRVNCGAIPPELVDSELFGHERGSFTGATALRRGWFERADGGTLFLDEVGDLPLHAQTRLLRVVQDGVFERVGGERPIRVDVRIVAATHRDLESMVAKGAFREDLFYRISVFVIRLPPLRERLSDLPALAAHFADRAGKRYGAGGLEVTPSDLALLSRYAWPGNIRELAAVIERAAVLGGGKRLELARALGSTLPRRPAAVHASATGREHTISSLDEALRVHIDRALQECGGRVEGAHGAARVLGVNPNTLRSKMRKLGISPRRHRGGG